MLDLTGIFTCTDADKTGDVYNSVFESVFIIDKYITIKEQGADQTIIQAASSAGVAERRNFAIVTG